MPGCITGNGEPRFPSSAVLRAAPEARAIARHNRAFLQRVVRFLVRDRGIRQIIDVGTGK
jgi:S-adenosyl methyltransferase